MNLTVALFFYQFSCRIQQSSVSCGLSRKEQYMGRVSIEKVSLKNQVSVTETQSRTKGYLWKIISSGVQE